jgi:hypothetical protein
MNVVCHRKSVCLLVILLVVSAPLMACALPGQEMTAEEQACCLHMSDECGGAQMSDAHTCCNKTPQVDRSILKAGSKHTPAASELLAQASFCTAPAMSTAVRPRRQNGANNSPSPPGSISILRI